MTDSANMRKIIWDIWRFGLGASLLFAIARKLIQQHVSGQPLEPPLIFALALVIIGVLLGLLTMPARYVSGSPGSANAQIQSILVRASMASFLLLGALFAVMAIMPDYATRWALQGDQLSAYQELLLWVAAFWSGCWWLGTPIVILFSFGITALVSFSKRAGDPQVRSGR